MLDLFYIGEFSDKFIIDRPQKADKFSLFALGLYGTDDFVAVFPFCDQRRDHLGRVLKIRAHGNDAIPRRLQDTVKGRIELSEISGVKNRLDLFIGSAQFFYPRAGAVGWAVIDKYDLVVVWGGQALKLPDDRLA